MDKQQQTTLNNRLHFLQQQAKRAEALPEAARARTATQYSRIVAEIAELEQQLTESIRAMSDEELPLHRRWPPNW